MPIEIKGAALQGAEFAWFAPLCNGDDAFLGRHDDVYKSTFSHTSDILLTADQLGFRNILCPSSYQVGQDTFGFAAAVAPQTQNISLLVATRCGEVHPPMLARSIATLDHILQGRLTINIISSNLPGEDLDSASRYARSSEVIQILQQAWTQDFIDFQGAFYKFKLPSLPVKPYQQNGGPLLYFGGYSPPGVDLCARYCDVYLMWPETEERLGELMQTMSDKAAGYGRKVDFGLRIHVIVRETEAEARAYARQLMQDIDKDKGDEIRNRALDAQSLGVARQSQMRDDSDNEGFVEDHLWTGIGRARSGCGAALVGDPDQIARKIERYMKMGIRAFIFSGYPHQEEAQLFAQYVLPRFQNISLAQHYQRIPTSIPMTPLGAAKRT
ncbi:MAG: LLM class flavin-dependent oxidoreductase [Bacteroidota bacterium]